MIADPFEAFRQAADRPEGEIDLGRAALTIALPDYPDLDIDGYIARLDALGAEVAGRAGAHADARQALSVLNGMLFVELGFRGNRDNYFDARNSFLNEVLERKTGIPISLSVVYMEVGRRAGFSLDGVGFPGHFLVKFSDRGEEMIVDPFARGEARSRSDLEGMLRRLYGKGVELRPEFLQAARKKQILKRMLANLKGIYTTANDPVKTLSVLDRLILLDPVSATDIRDRGLVYLKLQCATQARADLQTYLQLAPGASDADAVRAQIRVLAGQRTTLH